LIVDVHIRVKFTIFFKPLLLDGGRKRCPGTVNCVGGQGGAYRKKSRKRGQHARENPILHSLRLTVVTLATNDNLVNIVLQEFKTRIHGFVTIQSSCIYA
jgi:hypothetical protein